MRRDVARLEDRPFAAERPLLGQAIDDLEAATAALLGAIARGATDAALAGATPYLRLFALAVGGGLFARMAAGADRPDPVAAFRFYAHNLVGETGFRRMQVVNGAASVVAVA